MFMELEEVKPAVSALQRHPLELGIVVVCNACGMMMDAQWIVREEAPKQAILCVEKCLCDSPLLKG